MNRRMFFLTLATVPLALVAKPKPLSRHQGMRICCATHRLLYSRRLQKHALHAMNYGTNLQNVPKLYNTWYTWDEGPWRHYG